MIRIQRQDFSIEDESKRLRESGKTGAVVTFVGIVREFSAYPDAVFTLEHYPGMTEAVLERIENEAHARWSLHASSIIHRVGTLSRDEQIVFVGVSSAHRADAFAACEFMIDLLKTEAPFWKKEGDKWVTANDEDQPRAERWMSSDERR